MVLIMLLCFFKFNSVMIISRKRRVLICMSVSIMLLLVIKFSWLSNAMDGYCISNLSFSRVLTLKYQLLLQYMWAFHVASCGKTTSVSELSVFLSLSLGVSLLWTSLRCPVYVWTPYDIYSEWSRTIKLTLKMVQEREPERDRGDITMSQSLFESLCGFSIWHIW